MGEDDSFPTQLIYGDGGFNAAGLDCFAGRTGLNLCGLSYAVVAIMGPQSSGKSTLMNHLFRTSFREMDAFRGRSQTTKGISIAKCPGIDPFTIAMDLEGTDGRERGEDDTAFEKQSALFALAVADIVLINMWCHDIGREQAANKPLLRTVCQVMMRLFSPRKTTLLFVIRDKTKTPLEYLEPTLREDIQKIWDGVPKPEAHKSTPLSEFFNVEVTALSSFEEKEEQFKEQVAELRQRFFHSISPGGLAGDRRGVVPATGFSFSAQQIWKTIKENKDLDLPAQRVMVETFRCKEIADDKFGLLSSGKGWLELKKAVLSGPVPQFGRQFRSILDTYLTLFDKEAMYFDDGIRSKQRQDLQTRAVRELADSYFLLITTNYRSKALEDLKKLFGDNSYKRIEFGAAIRTRLLELDEACKDAAMELFEWDTSDSRKIFLSDIERQLIQLHDSKLLELATVAKDKLAKTLSTRIESDLQHGAKMWELIRGYLVKNTEQAVTEFAAEIAHLQSSQALINLQKKNLRQHAKNVAERTVRKLAEDIQQHMEIRFERVFTRNDDGRKKYWTKVADIDNLILEARTESLKILAAVVALRFSGQTDNIQGQLLSALIDGTPNWTEGEGVMEFDPLACKKWAEVSSSDTLITPEECKRIWSEFINKPKYIVDQAKEKKRREYEQKKEARRQMAVAVVGVIAGIASAVTGVGGGA